jgi:glycosyltransferase involved in cell wall biosynthesis
MDTTVSTPRGAVVLVTPRWTRDGGVGAHVQVSAAALAERGIEVRVVAETIDAEPGAPDVPVLHAPRLFDGEGDIDTRLAGALAGETAVVHLHQVDDPKIVSAAGQRAPVVVSAHGYNACTSGVYYFEPGRECVRGHGVGCIPNLIARGCAHTAYPKTLPRKFRNATTMRTALRGADLTVSYSTAVDRHLANNGLERRLIVPYFPTMPARAGSGHAGRRRVVFAGRVVRPKGVDVLIEAARDVDGEFVLCGDGRDLDAMRALARELGIEERVQFTGWLDAGGLAQQLAEASVVVVPSLWPEPFGLVGIEGFAAGRPAVASATGGIPDWLDDGESGIAVPPADAARLAAALTELLADPGRQAQMGAVGRERTAARFTAERHVSVLLGGYERAREHWVAAR